VRTANARKQRELNVDEREEWYHFRGRDVPCFRSRGLRFNGLVVLSAVPDRRDHRVSHFFGKKGLIAFFFFSFLLFKETEHDTKALTQNGYPVPRKKTEKKRKVDYI
jgi:hypothetical protein